MEPLETEEYMKRFIFQIVLFGLISGLCIAPQNGYSQEIIVENMSDINESSNKAIELDPKEKEVISPITMPEKDFQPSHDQLEKFKEYYLEAMKIRTILDDSYSTKESSEMDELSEQMHQLLLKALEYNPKSPEIFAIICSERKMSIDENLSACVNALELKSFASDDLDIKSYNWNEDFYIYNLMSAFFMEKELYDEALQALENSLFSPCPDYSWNEKINEYCPKIRGASGLQLVIILKDIHTPNGDRKTLDKLDMIIEEIENISLEHPSSYDIAEIKKLKMGVFLMRYSTLIGVGLIMVISVSLIFFITKIVLRK